MPEYFDPRLQTFPQESPNQPERRVPRRRNVMVAIPSHTGDVAGEFSHSLYHSGLLAAQNNINMAPIYLPGESILQVARSELLAIAIEHDVDDMVFIDIDEDWRPEDLLRLLSYPVDCVGAPVRKKTDAMEAYNVRVEKGGIIEVDEKTGLWLVDAVGTGFLRLSRRAIRTLWHEHEEQEYTNHSARGKPARLAFQVKVSFGDLQSEDFYICRKLRASGIKTYIDPSIVIGHYGRKRWAGNFKEWAEARNEAAQTAQEAHEAIRDLAQSSPSTLGDLDGNAGIPVSEGDE